ncbi:MAG: chromate efflux transporter [Thermomicrobiales bacterium]
MTELPPDDERPRSAPPESALSGALEVGWVAFKLGLISFGGPVAHLGYFREEYVRARRWLDDETYADLVALCQFLPGPASSQVGIGIGTLRAGMLGGFMVWLGFTLPSAVALTLFAYSVDRFDIAQSGWIHGLKIVAVAIVAQAVWGMGRQFCSDRTRATIAILATLTSLAIPRASVQPAIILAAGVAGWWLFRNLPLPPLAHGREGGLDRRVGAVCLAIFALLLIGLPILSLGKATGAAELFARFYWVGSLVFGGGHLVLPLMQTQVVPTGWLSNNQFLAGYGAAQAVPGPLFSFAAYLGAVRDPEPNGVTGAVLGLVAIFLPSFLLVWGALPFWEALRAKAVFRGALHGINAAVVGILLAALYSPVWTSAILGPADVGLAVACAARLMIGTAPPWTVVVFGALAGEALSRF